MEAMSMKPGILTSMVSWVCVSSLIGSAAPAALYWCPNTQGGTVQDRAAAGCDPLVDKPESMKTGQEADRDGTPIRDIEKAIGSFKHAYNQLLGSDLKQKQLLNDIETLDERATELLAYLQNNMSPNKLLGVTARGAIVEISQARDRLRTLKTKLKQRGPDKAELSETDIGPPLQQTREGSTGPGLGQSFVSGPDIGTPWSGGRSGNAIGSTSVSGRDIGSTPTVGADIGTTPKTGPAIGSSGFNAGP
jgi:hypothetical protein